MLHLVPILIFKLQGMARLFSNMVILIGDVVHGPYLISDNSVSLTVGDDVEFDFRAMAEEMRTMSTPISL